MDMPLQAKDLRLNNWIAIDGKPYQLSKGEDLDNLSGKEPLRN